MAAPSIPNLLSMRGRRGPPRRNLHDTGPGSNGGQQAKDQAVRDTDDDAAISRMSAVSIGFLEDRFARLMVSGSEQITRRLPIINRGTYIRTVGLDLLVDGFLKTEGQRQIISLGAGSDTRIFKLLEEGVQNLSYHEIDFSTGATSKMERIQAQKEQFGFLGTLTTIPTTTEGTTLWKADLNGKGNNEYYCHGVDLRLLGKEETGPFSVPFQNVPTLLISECCLCYLETAAARRVVTYFTEKIADIGIILYEPTKPDDAFGQMMLRNFAARNIRMPSLEVWKTPGEQVQRLKEAGFEMARAETMDRLWKGWVRQEEKDRLDDLQRLDEVEEWDLLGGHYLISWGSRGKGFEGWTSID